MAYILQGHKGAISMASKKGPLSKAERFYIEEHIKSGKDINDIAIDLDRPIKAIQRSVQKVKKEIGNTTSTNAGEQFARRPGVTIMTENASSLGDKRGKTKIPQQTHCIVKIKDE
jgi:hypothetical protein